MCKHANYYFIVDGVQKVRYKCVFVWMKINGWIDGYECTWHV